MLNDYDSLAGEYQQTNVKPDKKYSTLPTVLKVVGGLEGKTVLDLGCGSGFFTNAFAQAGASKVIGIDNSTEQLALAKLRGHANVEYVRGDVFVMKLPKADTVVAPYVVNYAETTAQLRGLFQNIFDALSSGGKFVAVVDLPEGKDMKRFGAVKIIKGDQKDETPIDIQLFNNDELICTLHAVYFKPETIDAALKEIGFIDVAWHKPILSQEGVAAVGEDFWKGYLEAPELGYLSAIKP